jgi:hypothetical protein
VGVKRIQGHGQIENQVAGFAREIIFAGMKSECIPDSKTHGFGIDA